MPNAISKEEEIKLVTNNPTVNVYDDLRELFATCKSFCLSVAFINFSGLQLLISSLTECEKRGVKGKILCSDYLKFTDSNSIRRLYDFKNIETRMFRVDSEKVGFHTKGYIFEFDDHYKILIGSSNITQTALKSNVEWNLRVISKKDESLITILLNEFDNLMNRAREVDDTFVKEYEEYFKLFHLAKTSNTVEMEKFSTIEPNYFQQQVVTKLSEFRENGIHKGLIIASTGIGKTYASAFDVKSCEPRRVLYIVHNETILEAAKISFQRVIKNRSCGLLTGHHKDETADFIFTTIQTISRDDKLEKFNPKTFDYIIVDEVHRILGATYQKVLKYFEPEFLLGMTATPERTDGGNIYKLFDYNIAIDIRLEEALMNNLLVPFHYFGINDETVDLAHLDLDNLFKLSTTLSVQKRVDFIVDRMKHFGHDGIKRKCLAFCVDKQHCNYMARAFNEAGFHAIALTGDNPPQERDKYIDLLQSDYDPLEIICTVNIFNEGVDIPEVNLILMLRPTQSAIIFTQQLGRGLRKYPKKEFLTVLDFIANHNRCYLISVALSGKKGNDKDSIKVKLKKGMAPFGPSNVDLDPITVKRILEQLEQKNFNEMRLLRQTYMDYASLFQKEIPSLTSYLDSDFAPDPMRFIKKAGNYCSFVNVCYRENKIPLSEEEKECLDLFSSMLPLTHLNEYLAFKSLLSNDELSEKDFETQLGRLVFNTSMGAAKYTFKLLSGEFYDASEIKLYTDYFVIQQDKLLLGNRLKEILCNKQVKSYIEDLIQYGILRYLKDFGNTNYGLPFLKPYSLYSMRDLGPLTQYEKKHSSIRGQGVWHDSHANHYIFVDLNKDADIKESINYKDKFIDSKHFQWQSQNKTTQDSKDGKIFTDSTEKENIHLFVRKIKKEDGVIMPYLYVGKVRCLSYKEEKPITIQYELEQEIPYDVYEDLTEVVKK